MTPGEDPDGLNGPERTVERHASRPTKDIWDKVSALTVPFVSLIIGLLGAYATYTSNQTALRQQVAQAEADRQQRAEQADSARLLSQAQTLEGLYVFVASEDEAKRLFGYEMFVALGQKELAAKLIGVVGDKAGIPLLKKLEVDENATVSAAASQSLASFENATAAGRTVLRSRGSCREFVEMGFRTKRTPATSDDYKRMAARLGVEPEALSAFMTVETASSTLTDGRPRILFERQIFRRLTEGIYDSSHPDISSRTPGGYGSSGAHQYNRLAEAAALNCPAALAATSWGAFQILGQNSEKAGYEFVDDFVRDIMISGSKELDAAIPLIESEPSLVRALRNKDWVGVATTYNGPNSVATNRYDKRLADAYQAAGRSRP